MTPHVADYEILQDYKVKVTFSTGEIGIFDMAPYFEKGMFKELKVHIEYAQNLEYKRNKRWIDCSGKLGKLDGFIYITVQQLGTLDARLVKQDERIISGESSPDQFPFGYGEHLTQSYLWVLGAYEIIRVLDQRAKENDDLFPDKGSEIDALKHKFARIRMPLAKFEASKKHKKTDSHIAYPYLNTQHGVAWRVSENDIIARRELSDAFLELLESL